MNKLYLLTAALLFCTSVCKSQASSEPTREAIAYFYYAIPNNDTVTVLAYIQTGKLAASYEPSGKITPLEAAIWANSLPVVKILVANGANINSKKTSAIDACVERQSHIKSYTKEDEQKTFEILKYLLAEGGNPNTENNAFYAAADGQYKVAGYLLMAGAAIGEDFSGSRGKLRFILAAVERKDYEVLDRLVWLADVINECNCGGNALTLAVRGNDMEMVRYLLSRGANKDTSEADVYYDDFIYNDTPYELAISYGYEEIAELLK